MKKIAISIGDLNGIGLEIALKAHEEVAKLCQPIYCISETMLLQGAKKLKLEVPHNFNTISCGKSFTITQGVATAQSGEASYASFLKAYNLTRIKYTDALVTLPINKEAWHKANINFKGHTEALESLSAKKPIMMLGCSEMFVGLFTHHIPLKEVSQKIQVEPLKEFLLNFYAALKVQKIGVLGLNPHAGDNGVIGDEEEKIKQAIDEANQALKEEIFTQPLVPDVAFSKENRKSIKHFVCMYHDQGLIPLKSLYFEESINVSLGLDELRVSVDHGTAYDKAYKNANPSTKSYLNALKYAVGK